MIILKAILKDMIILGNTTSIKSNEVFLISANNRNKCRNLMQNKILYIEVYLPLHRLQDKLRHNIAT